MKQTHPYIEPYEKYKNKVITIKKLNRITAKLFNRHQKQIHEINYTFGQFIFNSLTKYNLYYDCDNDNLCLFDVIVLYPSDYVISLYIEKQKNPNKIKIIKVSIES